MSITSSLLELLIIIGIGLTIPGPNALTSFAHSGLFGKKSNVSLITGMAIGLFIMELLVGLTIESLADNDNGKIILHWIGLVFLFLMGVAMFNFDLDLIDLSVEKGKLGLKTGIMMQFVNGKEWAFVIMMMSQFIEPMGGGLLGIMIIIFMTLSICIPAMIAWTIFGNKLTELFLDPVFSKRIFSICGTSLILLMVVFFIRGPMI
jgi:threonine/homoserine/homoserine lactone efflux protein